MLHVNQRSTWWKTVPSDGQIARDQSGIYQHPLPRESDNAASQIYLSASDEQDNSQSQPLLDTPSQATPSYTGVVQAGPTQSPPIQRPSKPAPPLKPAPPTPGKYTGKGPLEAHNTADSNSDPEDAKRKILENPDNDDPSSAEEEIADADNEHTEENEENTPHPSGTQAEKSPVTPPSGWLYKSFMNAMATTGFDWSNLMRKLKGPKYYTCKGLYIQHTLGDYSK